MVLVEITAVQGVPRVVGFFMAQGVFGCDFGQCQAFDGRRGVAEILVDEVSADADGFKNLGA